MGYSEGQLSGKMLRRFDQLAGLGAEKLASLARRVQVLEAEAGTALVELGSRDAQMVYLLDGQVRLEAEDGYTRYISHRDAAARSPLCRLRPSRWRALAAGPVRYLQIADDLVAELIEQRASDRPTTCGYAVSEVVEDALEELARPEDALLFKMLDDLSHHRVVVLSLPPVARFVAGEIAIGDPHRAVEGLMLDPALTLKVLHLANSRRQTGHRARSCRAAVDWLGMEAVHDLVTQFALLESFRHANPAMEDRAMQWWQQSLLTSLVCRGLAERAEGFDPTFAALVGLTHNVGEAFILSHAQRQPQEWMSHSVFERCIQRRAAEMGRFVLARWHVPVELARTAAETGNWWRDTGVEPDYTDLALIAQLMVRRASTPEDYLPEVVDLPSVRRLGEGWFRSDFTDEILGGAREKVSDVLRRCSA